MANNDIAVRVAGVSKDFILPHEKVATVKRAFTTMFRRNRTTEVQHALKDVSFEIKKGEFFGIVGRNGSGKSTMLKIIAGIYQPSKGKVDIDGKLVPFIELGVGGSNTKLNKIRTGNADFSFGHTLEDFYFFN